MKIKIKPGSIYVKIIFPILIGIVLLALFFSIANTTLSMRIFAETYVESQKYVFQHVEEQFSNLYQDIFDFSVSINRSNAIQRYTQGNQSPLEAMSDIVSMQHQIQNTNLARHLHVYIMIVDLENHAFLHNLERITTPIDEILKKDISQRALTSPDELVSGFTPQGFTETTQNDAIVIFAKALTGAEYNNHEPYGILYVFWKESDFKKTYSFFTSETNNIFILNRDHQIISTSFPSFYIPEKNGLYFMEGVHKSGYTILGVVDPETAFLERHDISGAMLLAFLVTLCIGLFIFIIIRKQLKPLTSLVNVMERIEITNMNERVKEEGADEIQTLTKGFNNMLEMLNQQFHNQVQAQEEKRSAEISALQAQINPHFMYNTLTSIKWLIWQGNSDKSVVMIDAFISLLRNTISNENEFISVAEEIENLRHYTRINQMRYTDNIHVDFYISSNCKSQMVPKLILQPFLENAFFHAFPDGQKGNINVFVTQEKQYLKFEIIDDGVGIQKEQLLNTTTGEYRKGEHFTGIGIDNVDNRIKLIYGDDYGIHVDNRPKGGTTVTIYLPMLQSFQKK
ncbi:MAG: sensor histidine kinase [Lachnospiraceae bacterium]|nr:sensor histidine kinase [Lachnospiraceae bacterium]